MMTDTAEKDAALKEAGTPDTAADFPMNRNMTKNTGKTRRTTRSTPVPWTGNTGSENPAGKAPVPPPEAALNTDALTAGEEAVLLPGEAADAVPLPPGPAEGPRRPGKRSAERREVYWGSSFG